MGIDAELGISVLPARAYQLRRSLFIPPIEPNGSFQHQKDVKTLFFDFCNYLGNLVGLSQGAVNGLSQILHELFQTWIHGKLLYYSFWMLAGVLQFYTLEAYADFRATISKMAEISNVKNALQTVVKKDRFLNAAFAGGKSLVVSLGRVAYAFWLQTTGLMFLLFTSFGVFDLARKYRQHTLDSRHLVVIGLFTLVCAYFTVHSFIKASRTIKKRGR